jgi:hypothetical protein
MTDADALPAETGVPLRVENIAAGGEAITAAMPVGRVPHPPICGTPNFRMRGAAPGRVVVTGCPSLRFS